ncbi:MAG: flavodoxin [Lachnospirales bacterium]
MSKIKVVYWSGTGNTETMANAVVAGIVEKGGEAEALSVDTVKPEDLQGESVFALGCPSMGAEVLEEDEMEPFVEAICGFASGKKIVLFGSYDWGDGEWMRNWVERMEDAGAVVVGDGIIANLEPDDEAIASCKKAGMELV